MEITQSAEGTVSIKSKNYFPRLILGSTVILAILKVTGCIDWDWVWVLSPLWGIFAIAAALLLLMAVFSLLLIVVEIFIPSKKKKEKIKAKRLAFRRKLNAKPNAEPSAANKN